MPSNKQSSSSSTEAVSSTNVSRTAYKKSVSTKKSGLHDEGTTTYYYGTCPHSGCDREFKVMAYFKNNPTTSISIPKHYDCFSCGKSVTYVNPRVGLLTRYGVVDNIFGANLYYSVIIAKNLGVAVTPGSAVTYL